MQSNSFSRPGFYTSKDRFGKITHSVYPAYDTGGFTVSGFGSNDYVHPTSGTFSKARTKKWQGNVIIQDNPYNRELRGQLGLAYTRTFPFYDFSTLDNMALTRLHDQLRSSIDLSIDAFQAGSTARMVKSMRKVVQYVKSFTPNQWAKRWLEYQYGIRPLMSTVYEAATQLVAPARQGQYDVEGTASDHESGIKPGAALNSLPVRDIWNDSRRVKYWARFTIVKPSAVQQIAQWSSVNPASIAYELVPFSFVADWFYDLGGYMRNMETALLYMNNLDFCGVTRTRLYSVKSESIASGNGVTQNVQADYEYRYKLRSSTSFAIPSPPRFEARMGWQRVLSAAALISEAVGSRKR